jgi:Kef-type K+ transport system membrane component KefB
MHHDILLFLLGLAVLLGVARVFGEVCRAWGLPAVAGEILAGVALGRTILGRVAPGAYAWLFPDGPAKTMLTGYTTVAVMLLLVVAGLEVDLTVVRKSGRVVLATSLLGMIVPFVLGYATGYVLPASDLPDPGRRALHAAFLGIALSISALPVIAKTLLDLGLMKTDLGLTILSAAVLNDLVGWAGFSVLSQRFTPTGEGKGLLATAVPTAAFVVIVLVGVRPVVDRLLRFQGSDENASGRVLSMIMVLALFGAAVTQALGMHAVFGGFVMGIAVGDSSRLREHTRQVLHDFVTYVFTPAFFATMALRYDFAASFDLGLVAIILAIACIAKVAGCAAGARLVGVGWREAAALGFGMNSRGAMEILLAVIALEAGIISEKLFVALVVMAVVTSLISGPALVRLLKPSPSPIVALLGAGEVVLDAPARSREEALEALASALAARAGRAEDGRAFAARVLERERLAGTGVGEGVAFPHAEIDGLRAPLLAFARLDRGIDCDAPDGHPVRLVFMLLMPPREYDLQLQLLSAMARLMTEPGVREGLMQVKDAKEVAPLLEEAGVKSQRAPQRATVKA